MRLHRIATIAFAGLLIQSVAQQTSASGLILDEFDKPELHLSWSWQHENPDTWSLSERPGYLRMMTEAGSLYGGGQARNILLRRIPPSELNARALLEFDPKQDYQEAGIMLYEDDDNYIKLSRIHHSDVGGSCLLLAYEKDGKDQPGSLMAGYQGAKEIELALIRRSRGIVGAYREKGADAWVKLGMMAVRGDVYLPYMGVFAHNGADVDSIAADLDAVRISIEAPLRVASATAPDEKDEAVPGPSVSGGHGLVLSPAWMGPQSGVDLVLGDLVRMLKPYGEAAIDLASHPDLRIYKDITYLMPVQEAAGLLGLRTTTKRMLDTPGFPKNSFYAYEIRGHFEQRFDTLQLVTDAADQVVALQFSNSKPQTGWLYDHDETWSLYNVIAGKRKGSRKWKVAHHFHMDQQILRVDSELKDRHEKSREWAQLYLPEPIIDIVLHRGQKLLN